MSTPNSVGALLEWGVRESFVGYVEGLPDGVVEASAGAVRTEGGFVLPGRVGEGECFSFDGVLRFSGHHGVLNVELQALRVSCSGDRGEVSALISGMRYPLAELSEIVRGEGGILHSSAVTFTDDGAAILGGVYPPGAKASPLAIRHAL